MAIELSRHSAGVDVARVRRDAGVQSMAFLGDRDQLLELALER
jgi:hypothetical protein